MTLKNLYVPILALILGLMFLPGCNRKSNNSGGAAPVYTELAVGTPLTGTFTQVGETHFYCVNLEGGTLYRVSTSSLSADVDTVLQLLAEEDFLLVENDDSNDGISSELYFWTPVDAKFYIRVSDKDTLVPEGLYDILVEFVDQAVCATRCF